MKIHIVFLKTILAIFIYSLFYSFLSSFKIDFISLKANEFKFGEFLSISFLMIIYLIFSFYIFLIFLIMYLIEYFRILDRINIVFLILMILVIFYILTLVFDINFKDTNASLNRFIYSCLSISLVVCLLFMKKKKTFI